MRLRAVTVPPVIVPFALACASGLLSCLAFPPVGLWPLAFIAPWPLALAVAGTGRGAAPGAFAAARAVFAASILKWGILHAWLVQVTAVGTPALVVYCSLHDALAAWMLVRAMRAAPCAPLALLVPLVFGASEAFRAMVLFDGYPWFRWGHPLVEWPVVVQAADAIGELHATLLALVVALASVPLALASSGCDGGAAGAAGAAGASDEQDAPKGPDESSDEQGGSAGAPGSGGRAVGSWGCGAGTEFADCWRSGGNGGGWCGWG